MKIQSTLILFAVYLAISCRGRVAYAQEMSLMLKANPSHDGVIADSGVEKLGETIYLVVNVENQSGRTFSSNVADCDEYYTFDILDEQGRPVPEKERLRNLRESLKPGGRRWRHGLISEIEPGVSWKEQLFLSEYYDMSRPGKYTIQLQRKLPEELGKGTVKSNIITITVLPPDPPADEPK